MGAAFYSPGTVRIRKLLHGTFGPNKIQTTATNFKALFDPAQNMKISDILQAMDLPPLTDIIFGSRLQKRFKLLFDKMLASDNANGTTTHNDIRQATFEALVAAQTSTNPKSIKFYVAHQDDPGPFSPANPEFRFVKWSEDDDNDKAWFNFLLICPELPTPIARKLKRAIEYKRAKKSSKKKKVSKR